MTAGAVEQHGQTKRRRALAMMLVLAGAGLAWASSRAGWIVMTVADGLQPARLESVIGATWAAELGPIALAMGAAVIAMLVVRGRFHRLVGVVIAVLAGAAAVSPIRVLVTGVDENRVRQLESLPVRAEIADLSLTMWAPSLALLGAVAGLAGAALAIAAPGTEGAAQSRYQTPAARRDDVRAVMRDEERDGAISGGAAAGIPLNERLLWDALDAGEDPTAGADEGPDNSGNRPGLG
ncbi:TIGR02234 family membrane protein [Hoyosella altamirensis]|uniref:Putative membrane protein (TIGR02234 family) n=1 Tax=Hoyosella altamirensis TaxID=616997 RepID=A0A839RRK5_9ACTN|nr:TIGR02234 family membrane protein [Hoyosella altamirensis]MBB3038734.1 putative membrane protein (TIGR02234 family) [Hoyosella altamirensis]